MFSIAHEAHALEMALKCLCSERASKHLDNYTVLLYYCISQITTHLDKHIAKFILINIII
jgi:hypothetical protein